MPFQTHISSPETEANKPTSGDLKSVFFAELYLFFIIIKLACSLKRLFYKLKELSMTIRWGVITAYLITVALNSALGGYLLAKDKLSAK